MQRDATISEIQVVIDRYNKEDNSTDDLPKKAGRTVIRITNIRQPNILNPLANIQDHTDSAFRILGFT